MFRLQNNTPPYYIDESRDFQLLCRLYDCVNAGVRFNINSMKSVLDATKASDALLDLICTKVGFFTNRHFNSEILRYILSAFPYIVKYKGSRRGIELAVWTILKLEGEESKPDIKIDNDSYTINIYTPSVLFNKDALDEILKYIIPVGYTYNISVYQATDRESRLGVSTKIKTMVNPSISVSQVRGTDRADGTANQFDLHSDLEQSYIGAIGSAQIIGSDNYLTAVDSSGNTKYASDRNNTNRDVIDSSTATSNISGVTEETSVDLVKIEEHE